MPASDSLRALAAQTGYSLATVSMALRDLPRVAAKTRRIIQKAARKAGYQANARIAGAMRQIRQPSAARRRDTLAWICQPYRPGWRPDHDYLLTMRLAAAQRAARLGWQLEEIHLGDPRWPAKSIGRILYHRGIHAAVFPPFQEATGDLGIDFSRLAAVAIGYSLTSPALSRVTRSAIDSMENVFHELLRRGYRRPAFIQFRDEHLRTHRLPWAGFLTAQQELPSHDRLPVLTANSHEEIPVWIRKHQPDVVIGDRVGILQSMRQAGIRVPLEMGFVLNTRTEENKGIAGLEPNYHILAESALDLAIQLARNQEYGVPKIPRVLLVANTWKNGQTLRPPTRSANKCR